jgi:hypothetical protein
MNALLKLRNFAEERAAINFRPGSPTRACLYSKACAFEAIVRQIDRQLKFRHNRKHDRRVRR